MDNKLGTIICQLRKEKGLTQKELANKLNISDKAVSRWETGSSSPNMDMLLRISKFFEVPLNDLITARVSTEDTDENLVQEIIQEFTERDKKRSKRLKIIGTIAALIVLILTITIIFTQSYNRFKVYKVYIENSDIYPIKGVYVETKIKDILNIGDLKIKNIEIEETDIIAVDLYYTDNNKEYIIQSYSSLDNINFVSYQSYIEIEDLSKYFDNIYLKITIINSKNKKQEYVTKLNFSLDFSNNKVFYNEDEDKVAMKSYGKIPVDEIKEILLNIGYEETTGDVLWKQSGIYSINYLSKSNNINFNYEKNKLSYRYTYHLNNDILDVKVFDENTTEIENYKYDVTNDKVLYCYVGSCTSYKYAMKILNKNILDLLYNP